MGDGVAVWVPLLLLAHCVRVWLPLTLLLAVLLSVTSAERVLLSVGSADRDAVRVALKLPLSDGVATLDLVLEEVGAEVNVPVWLLVGVPVSLELMLAV